MDAFWRLGKKDNDFCQYLQGKSASQSLIVNGKIGLEWFLFEELKGPWQLVKSKESIGLVFAAKILIEMGNSRNIRSFKV